MLDSRGPGVLRRLAAFLIRGPEATFILADMDDALERELARGIPLWRMRWRYAVNMFGSAFSVWRARRQVPNLGFSWLNVKLGLRLLVKHPGLTCVAVFALAVAIPAGLAPMHFVNAVQASLPFDEDGRIQMLRNVNLASSGLEAPSLNDFLMWREELTTFEALGAATIGASYNLISDDGRAAPIRGAEVTASAFDILRVPPLLGRTLISTDEVFGAPTVVVIGYDLWQSRLDGDRDVVGKAIRIGRAPHTVVGVMPKEFLFPFRDQLWLPLQVNGPPDEVRQGRAHRIFGRLSDGMSTEEAQAELTTVGRRLAIEFPDTHARLKPEVVPFAIGFFDLPKGGMQANFDFYVVQVLTLLVLVVACANVGMLIFARTATRSRELAVRTALGASRKRIVSQLFMEALVFAVLAAGVGLLLGDYISSQFSWMLDFMPFWIDLGVTFETVVWALSLAVLSAGVVGVVPEPWCTTPIEAESSLGPDSHHPIISLSGIPSAVMVLRILHPILTSTLCAANPLARIAEPTIAL